MAQYGECGGNNPEDNTEIGYRGRIEDLTPSNTSTPTFTPTTTQTSTVTPTGTLTSTLTLTPTGIYSTYLVLPVCEDENGDPIGDPIFVNLLEGTTTGINSIVVVSGYCYQVIHDTGELNSFYEFHQLSEYNTIESCIDNNTCPNVSPTQTPTFTSTPTVTPSITPTNTITQTVNTTFNFDIWQLNPCCGFITQFVKVQRNVGYTGLFVLSQDGSCYQLTKKG